MLGGGGGGVLLLVFRFCPVWFKRYIKNRAQNAVCDCAFKGDNSLFPSGFALECESFLFSLLFSNVQALNGCYIKKVVHNMLCVPSFALEFQSS